MPVTRTTSARIRGGATSVSSTRSNNLADNPQFPFEEVQKVARLVGVKTGHVGGEDVYSSDVCAVTVRDAMAAPRLADAR